MCVGAQSEGHWTKTHPNLQKLKQPVSIATLGASGQTSRTTILFTVMNRTIGQTLMDPSLPCVTTVKPSPLSFISKFSPGVVLTSPSSTRSDRTPALTLWHFLVSSLRFVMRLQTEICELD